MTFPLVPITTKNSHACIFICNVEYIGAGSGTTKLLLHLNGNSTDSSGNGNNGTDTNITYSLANGKFGQGAGFNGSSSRIQIPYSATLDSGTGGFSISCWFKTTQATSGLFYYRQEASGSHYQIQILGIGSATAGKPYFALRGSENNYYDLSTNNAYNDGSWHHIVGVYGGSSDKNLLIYVDGSLDNSTSIATAQTITYSSSTVLSIGRWYQSWASNACDYYNGSLDEMIFETKAWTAAEIKKYYTNSLGRF